VQLKFFIVRHHVTLVDVDAALNWSMLLSRWNAVHRTTYSILGLKLLPHWQIRHNIKRN